MLINLKLVLTKYWMQRDGLYVDCPDCPTLQSFNGHGRVVKLSVLLCVSTKLDSRVFYCAK